MEFLRYEWLPTTAEWQAFFAGVSAIATLAAAAVAVLAGQKYLHHTVGQRRLEILENAYTTFVLSHKSTSTIINTYFKIIKENTETVKAEAFINHVRDILKSTPNEVDLNKILILLNYHFDNKFDGLHEAIEYQVMLSWLDLLHFEGQDPLKTLDLWSNEIPDISEFKISVVRLMTILSRLKQEIYKFRPIND